jgi:hypothetical protein
MTKEELIKVKGGAISAQVLNAIARGINTLYNLGQAVGSVLRRALRKKICS